MLQQKNYQVRVCITRILASYRTVYVLILVPFLFYLCGMYNGTTYICNDCYVYMCNIKTEPILSMYKPQEACSYDCSSAGRFSYLAGHNLNIFIMHKRLECFTISELFNQCDCSIRVFCNYRYVLSSINTEILNHLNKCD